MPLEIVAMIVDAAPMAVLPSIGEHRPPDYAPKPKRVSAGLADPRNGCGLTFRESCNAWPLVVRLLLWATRNSRT